MLCKNTKYKGNMHREAGFAVLMTLCLQHSGFSCCDQIPSAVIDIIKVSWQLFSQFLLKLSILRLSIAQWSQYQDIHVSFAGIFLQLSALQQILQQTSKSKSSTVPSCWSHYCPYCSSGPCQYGLEVPDVSKMWICQIHMQCQPSKTCNAWEEPLCPEQLWNKHIEQEQQYKIY